jgi:hypothetical protein
MIESLLSSYLLGSTVELEFRSASVQGSVLIRPIDAEQYDARLIQ